MIECEGCGARFQEKENETATRTLPGKPVFHAGIPLCDECADYDDEESECD